MHITKQLLKCRTVVRPCKKFCSGQHQVRAVVKKLEGMFGTRGSDLYPHTEMNTTDSGPRQVAPWGWATKVSVLGFLSGEGPRSRRYGRTATLRLLVQPYDEDDDHYYCFVLCLLMEHRWSETEGETEVLGEKPVPVPLCPPQIPHGLTWDRTLASAVGGRRLTAWAMARPKF
jgi:hypothetical protein